MSEAETIEGLKRELEMVKASKRADRDSVKEYKELVVTKDELWRKYELALHERDILVLKMATWRSRALAMGWKETDEL